MALVTPLLAADPGGLRRLGVSDARTRQRIPAQPCSQSLAKRGVEPFERAVRTPPPEPLVDSLPGRKVSGQESPGAATLQDIEDRVEDLAGGVSLRSASPAGRRNVRLDAPPLGIREISRIAPFHAQERTSSTYPSRFSKQFRKGNSPKFASGMASGIGAWHHAYKRSHRSELEGDGDVRSTTGRVHPSTSAAASRTSGGILGRGGLRGVGGGRGHAPSLARQAWAIERSRARRGSRRTRAGGRQDNPGGPRPKAPRRDPGGAGQPPEPLGGRRCEARGGQARDRGRGGGGDPEGAPQAHPRHTGEGPRHHRRTPRDFAHPVPLSKPGGEGVPGRTLATLDSVLEGLEVGDTVEEALRGRVLEVRDVLEDLE